MKLRFLNDFIAKYLGINPKVSRKALLPRLPREEKKTLQKVNR